MRFAYKPVNWSPGTFAAVDYSLKGIIFAIVFGAAVASRLFAVIRHESIIHEFDPAFNYRASRVLTIDGYYRFWNWFDPTAWYPLGRAAGGTLYPGLMATSGAIHNFLHFFNINVHIRDVCVFLAPGFAGLTAWSTYMFTKTMKDESAGLLAGAFIAIAPGYISRSVAGSYDNEAIAIFLLMITFYLWIKALKEGSAVWGVITAIFYFYMVASWGGYVFITNMLPLHAFVLILMGRFSTRLKILFSWDTGYARKHIPIISSVSEHQPPAWPAFFFDLQMLVWIFPAGVYLMFRELRDEHIFVIIYAVMASYFASVMVRLMLTLTPVVCVTAAITISALLDAYLDPQEPDSAESTAEELVENETRSKGKSGRKSNKAGPSSSVDATSAADDSAVHEQTNGSAAPSEEAGKPWSFRQSPRMLGIYGLDSRAVVVVYTTLMLFVYVLHCTFVTSTAYSSPSIVLASRNPDGSQHIIDDFREAYDWLRRNTASDAKIMSWWDYGYQIALYSDRTTLVDNNTWNNTHIATVGKAMSSPEDKAYTIMQKHDVDYVLVMFGGLLGYSGDDINKFLWMIRIAQGIWPEEIREVDFFTPQGQYRIDDGATKTMKESLMYKMSYYRFNELFNGRPGMDRVRGTQAASVSPTLDYLDEAFTSENWIVRIYEVKKEDPLGRDLPAANAFNKGKRRKVAAVPPKGSASASAGRGKKRSASV
ncbi:hypothetical protein L7F22_019434 [Adiantum nelumboides]|nr:hypothetical protein [Adiantum nelumboides]